VCVVRDCFDVNQGIRGMGHPVFASNATRSQEGLCFTRRVHPEIKLKAHFDDLPKLVEFMHHLAREEEARLASYRKLTGDPDAEAHAYEDLFAFEYAFDEGVFRSSVDEWTALIGSLIGTGGDSSGAGAGSADANIVARELRQMQGGRPAPAPHDAVVHNLGEVAAALRDAVPPLDGYLRMPPSQQ